jgi:hypothetical protein
VLSLIQPKLYYGFVGIIGKTAVPSHYTGKLIIAAFNGRIGSQTRGIHPEIAGFISRKKPAVENGKSYKAKKYFSYHIHLDNLNSYLL